MTFPGSGRVPELRLDRPLRILHASDLQVGRPYLPEAADALVALADELAPDVVVISGDLTQRAKEREFLGVGALLRRFGERPVACVAGNHDVALYRIFERLLWPWRKWRRHIGEVRRVLRWPGRVVLVALSTAAPRRAVVNGRLPDRELNFAQEAFARADPDECRILVVHHPLALPPGGGSIKILPNSHALLERLVGMQVKIVLAGHAHYAFVRKIESGGDSVHLVHAGTATSSRRRHPERDANTVNVLDLKPAEAPLLTTYARNRGCRSFKRAKALRLLAVAISAGASIGGGPAPASAVGQGEVDRVRNVEFVGNSAFPADSLSPVVATRASECVSLVLSLFCWVGADFAARNAPLHRRDLDDDLARLKAWYHQRGYREAEIGVSTFEIAEAWVDVAFEVTEGEPVRMASFEVAGLDSALYAAVVPDILPTSGEPLSIVGLGVFRDTLEERLANLGYAHVMALRRTFIPSGEPYRAQVTFEVSPGSPVRFGPIEVTGNAALDRSAVLNTAQIREGERYSREALREAQVRLFGLDIVRRAAVATIPTDAAAPLADSILPVRIEIAEGDAYRLRYGVGVNGAECFDAEARWTARNFAGGGRSLGVLGRVSNIFAPELQDVLCPQAGTGEFAVLNWIASIDLVQPWIFSTRNSLATSVFGERSSLPNIFVREAVGARAAVTRALDQQTAVSSSYGIELSTLRAAEILFCAGLLVCDPQDIDILAERRRLAPWNLRFSRNLTTSILDPTSGYALRFDYEHAAGWTGSEFAYHRAVGEASWYSRASPRLIVAVRGRAGWVAAAGTGSASQTSLKIHPTKRFYAGGANSVRGFAQGGLGPRVLYAPDPAGLLESGACLPEALADLTCDPTALDQSLFVPRSTGGNRVVEANIETRFTLTSTLEGVAFVDVGQVWSSGAEFSLGDLEPTPGLGFRYRSPIGPLRVDLGYHFRSEEELSVAAPRIVPYSEGDDPALRLMVGGRPLPWLETSSLALLQTPRSWGEPSSLAWERLRLHVSIGQAF